MLAGYTVMLTGYTVMLTGYTVMLTGYTVMLAGYTVMLAGYTVMLAGYTVMLAGYTVMLAKASISSRARLAIKPSTTPIGKVITAFAAMTGRGQNDWEGFGNALDGARALFCGSR